MRVIGPDEADFRPAPREKAIERIYAEKIAERAAARPSHGLDWIAKPKPISVTASETRSGNSLKKTSSRDCRVEVGWSMRSSRMLRMRSTQKERPRLQKRMGLIDSPVAMNEAPARIPSSIPMIATASLLIPIPMRRRVNRRVNWRRRRLLVLEVSVIGDVKEKGGGAALMKHSRLAGVEFTCYCTFSLRNFRINPLYDPLLPDASIPR